MECRDGSGLLPQLGPSAAPALRFGICILIARYGSKCERTRLLASGLPPNDFDACLVPPLEGRLLSGAPPFSLCLVIALAATFAVVGAWNSQARDWV